MMKSDAINDTWMISLHTRACVIVTPGDFQLLIFLPLGKSTTKIRMPGVVSAPKMMNGPCGNLCSLSSGVPPCGEVLGRQMQTSKVEPFGTGKNTACVSFVKSEIVYDCTNIIASPLAN